ncbi:LytR/AlgR family response regulator transcription factor [Synoicihabitans lomoniglobus]|uniref:LytTR family DNA-binding domain-containing protein n=1 Tax=Synoicihabitans lomoniglobus TaxID=2909285 RepID=A0AAF0CPC4_9BACT|nr:LytTR family DNA-binding domain-containing protein [Opitutaceae bacterium LMO-M01]WED64009.1 LytTR family DNA-binding domain-containing protein [Opitutaceae bacterium LMO-M01]
MNATTPLRALLIDDEPPARAEIRRLLAAHPHIPIVGEAGNIIAARRRLRKAADYDLVFLDVQLIGGSGFDLVPDVAPDASIVFLTAYEQHAVRAFEVNAVDYLLKPATAERLAQSLRRVATQAATGPVSTGAPPALTETDTVLVRGGGGAEFVPLADIAAIESQQNYSRVRLTTGRDILVLQTLKAWEAQLPAHRFAQIRRGTLANLDRIEAIDRPLVGSPRVKLFGLSEPIPASRRQWAEIRNRVPGS